MLLVKRMLLIVSYHSSFYFCFLLYLNSFEQLSYISFLVISQSLRSQFNHLHSFLFDTSRSRSELELISQTLHSLINGTTFTIPMSDLPPPTHQPLKSDSKSPKLFLFGIPQPPPILQIGWTSIR